METRLRRVRAAVEEIEEVEESVQEETLEEVDENEVAEGKDDMDRIEDKYRARATSPLRAIRAFCVLCMGCQPRMVANCTAHNCVLYPYRFGKNPYQKHTKRAKK